MEPSSFQVSPKAAKAIHRMLKNGGPAPVLHRETREVVVPSMGYKQKITWLSVPKENVANEEDWIELAWLPF